MPIYTILYQCQYTIYTCFESIAIPPNWPHLRVSACLQAGAPRDPHDVCAIIFLLPDELPKGSESLSVHKNDLQSLITPGVLDKKMLENIHSANITLYMAHVEKNVLTTH